MSVKKDLGPPLALDGRARRSERSRHAIVTALLDLIGSGTLQPTAQQVADRAGVGIRSVFRHFSEMDSLYQAMDAHVEADAARILQDSHRPHDTLERVRALIRRRAALFERVGPYKRSADLQRWRSDFLQAKHARMQRLLRADLLEWLPELEGAPADVLNGVDLATSFEAWVRLRTDQQLSLRRAMATVESMVLALARESLSGKTKRR